MCLSKATESKAEAKKHVLFCNMGKVEEGGREERRPCLEKGIGKAKKLMSGLSKATALRSWEGHWSLRLKVKQRPKRSCRV